MTAVIAKQIDNPPPPSRSAIPREQIEDVLLRIGEILVKNELHTQWFSVKEIAKLCQKHRRKFPPQCFNAKEMRFAVLLYFEKHDYILSDLVKVEHKDEPVDRLWEHFVCFHQYDPPNDWVLV